MMTRHRRRDHRNSPAQAVVQNAVVDTGKLTDLSLKTPAQLAREICSFLRGITADAVLVEALTTTRQRRMVVLTADAKGAMTATIANERAARARRRAAEHLGQAWMRPDQDAEHHGKTATPGDVSALSTSDDITRTLRRVLVDLVDYDFPTPVPDLIWLEQVESAADRINELVRKAGEIDRPQLERAHKALEKLDERVRALIDGHNERSALRDPCPHCGRDTLIAFWDQNLIRCDRSPKSKHYAPCTCPDPLCECKNRPVAYRHTWFATRPARSSHSWQSLRSALEMRRAATEKKEPTK